MDVIIRKVSMGYIRLFPELLDRFHSENDRTIVKLISEKVTDNNELKGVVDINKLENNVEKILIEIKK